MHAEVGRDLRVALLSRPVRGHYRFLPASVPSFDRRERRWRRAALSPRDVDLVDLFQVRLHPIYESVVAQTDLPVEVVPDRLGTRAPSATNFT